jgi:hypothetical protein
MIENNIKVELMERMDKLNPTMQKRVVEYAQSLLESSPQGTSGAEYLKFAGIMTTEEAKEFLQAIEEDCERIDADEW